MLKERLISFVFSFLFVFVVAGVDRVTAADCGWVDGCVFLDLNCDGIFDKDTEPGIDGATVLLIDGDGQVVDSTVSSSASGLPGYYQVGDGKLCPDLPGPVLVLVDESSPALDGLAFSGANCDNGPCPDGINLGNPVSFDPFEFNFVRKLNIGFCPDDGEEPPSACWMTGGGVKFEPKSGIWSATTGSGKGGPRDTVGGVVYPSCSQFPSKGGQWNHVDHSNKLHLTGRDQTVVRCGNVEGIPPGTESPVCDVNFIEWTGVGSVKGIGGNKSSYPNVSYFGRVEDRNEPGNEQSANSGDDVDRYFLRVVDDDTGDVILLVDSDGVDDADGDGAFDVDPLTITGGNFQIHCTSCDGSPGGGAALPLEETTVFYFLRGDSNWDGTVDIADSMHTVGYLFLNGPTPECADAADTNDDGSVNIADPMYTVTAIFFANASPIPAPFPEAGGDATADGLGCLE